MDKIMKNLNKIDGKVIKQLMRVRGITNRGLAGLIGCTPANVGQLLNREMLRIETKIEILKALDFSEEELNMFLINQNKDNSNSQPESNIIDTSGDLVPEFRKMIYLLEELTKANVQQSQAIYTMIMRGYDNKSLSAKYKGVPIEAEMSVFAKPVYKMYA
jgi:transcriptional regulator with XRE-family HTH domain